jgi:hypothetical protein
MEQWGFDYQRANTIGRSVTYPVPFLAGSIPAWNAQITNHHGGYAYVLPVGTEGNLANGIPNPYNFGAAFIYTTFGAPTPTADIGFCWKAIGRWK